MLQSPVEYLLILRGDTIVAPTLLTRLMETATVTPEAGLWGPRAYYHSRPDTVWAMGFRWDPHLLNFVIQGQGDLAESRDIVHQVDALAGGAMLVRRDVFEQIGLLAPQYFSGWEEFDFCAQATAHGFKCLAVPEAKIWRGGVTHQGAREAACRGLGGEPAVLAQRRRVERTHRSGRKCATRSQGSALGARR